MENHIYLTLKDSVSADDRIDEDRSFESVTFAQMRAEQNDQKAAATRARKYMTVVTDEEIIRAKSQIEREGLRATADYIAARVTRNPDTNLPYHRVTVSRRLNEMRKDKVKV
jgi:hypothetical protein